MYTYVILMHITATGYTRSGTSFCLEKYTYMLCMVVAYTTTCTYTLHTFVMPVVPFPLFSPIMVVLPTLLFSHYVLYVCYFVCVCA